MSLRAALRSVSGCPVTGSLVLRGSIGPAVTLPCNQTNLAFALAFCWHVVDWLLCVWVCDCVAMFDPCARLQAVVQEVWEIYFSGVAVCVG